MSVRVGVLEEAAKIVASDRNNAYGPPTQDFARSAAMMSALGYRGPDGRDILPHDVALMVMCVKLSRLTWSPERRDSWVDLAGYAGCGFECVVDETNGEQNGEGSRNDYH